jgi:hypothetical protein
VNEKTQPVLRQSEIKLILRLRQLERERISNLVLLDIRRNLIFVIGLPEELSRHVTPSLTADSD